MQTLICSIIIVFALTYVAKRWLPVKLKQRLYRLCGRSLPATTAAGGCGSCSSCSNCSTSRGSAATAAPVGKKIFMVRSI